MNDINEVVVEWKEDSKINNTSIDTEILKTGTLHSKYLSYFLSFKRELTEAESKYNKLCWYKRKYFRGEMEKKDLDKFGWSQWQGPKTDVSSHVGLKTMLEMDTDLVALKKNISSMETASKVCEHILSEIKNRGYHLKNYVDYIKYINGD